MENYFASHPTMFNSASIGALVLGVITLLLTMAILANDSFESQPHHKYQKIIGFIVASLLFASCGICLLIQPSVENIRNQQTLNRIETLVLKNAKAQGQINYLNTKAKSENNLVQIQIDQAIIQSNQNRIKYLQKTIYQSANHQKDNNSNHKNVTSKPNLIPHATYVPHASHADAK